jgi:hypothetical protein
MGSTEFKHQSHQKAKTKKTLQNAYIDNLLALLIYIKISSLINRNYLSNLENVIFFRLTADLLNLNPWERSNSVMHTQTQTQTQTHTHTHTHTHTDNKSTVGNLSEVKHCASILL